MLAVSVLFIAAFASTWGPLVWAVTAMLFPARHRGVALGMVTSVNWAMNAAIALGTRFITDRIHYMFGMVFAGSCFALAALVYFFVVEPTGRTADEIDGMYRRRVNPRKDR